MKRFCVIGLGNFGYHVARSLFEDGHEVVAIDMKQSKVQRIHEQVSYAIFADAANKDFLEGQGIGDMDAVIVATGDRSHLSTLITLYLKELNVPRILVKVNDEDHGQIVKKVGATEIIFPEKDMAEKTALSLSRPNILDFIPLAEEYSITETAPPAHFVGKSLLDLHLRKDYDITVIAIKDVLTGQFFTLPPANHIIKNSDMMVIIGKTEDIERACNS
jgi:trk system potassium uptake protein TrkA